MTVPSFPAAPAQWAFPVSRSWRWSTQRQESVSGRSTRLPLRSVPIRDHTISFEGLDGSGNTRGGLTPSLYQTFVGFFNNVKSSPQGIFKFDDPEDDTVTLQANGTGDGTTTSYQLVSSFGGFNEPVTAPRCAANTPATGSDAGNCQGSTATGTDAGDCQGSTTIGADAGYCSTMQVFEASSGPDAWTLAPWTFSGGSPDASGGVVVISPAPGNGVNLAWTGVFDRYCEFPDDSLEFSEFFYQLMELKQVKFSTVIL